MAIRAVIFDLGGVLLEIDWERYRADKRYGELEQNLWPYEYERLNAELVRFLVTLRPLYKLAIICNSGSREAMNRKFRLGELVDLMVFDGEEGVSKPDLRIYQRTLARLGVLPEETVFVDDKQANVEAALRLGIHAVHFKSTTQTIAGVQNILQHSQDL